MANGYYNKRMTIEFFENDEGMRVIVRNTSDMDHAFIAEGEVVEGFLSYIMDGLDAIEEHIEKVEA